MAYKQYVFPIQAAWGYIASLSIPLGLFTTLVDNIFQIIILRESMSVICSSAIMTLYVSRYFTD